MRLVRNFPLIALLALSALTLGCGGGGTPTPVPTPPPASGVLDNYTLTGDVSFVHDPSILRQGSTYYVFTTDPGGATAPGIANGLQIRCSSDKIAWKICGSIFPNGAPADVQQFFSPNPFTTFWAPDVSYFNNLYHVYYTASSFGINHSLIGLVTTPTLDSTDPTYKWTDRGIVLQSETTDNFNAIDGNILVDTDATGALTHVWMQYGSYWGGIYQREIDPATGMLSTLNTVITNLATRPSVQYNPIEGSSLVHKGSYYYLFASFDFCCQTPYTQNNYKIAVGRSTSPNGPFVDQAGLPMLQGGGTILLHGNGTTWGAPGGETVYIDPMGSDLIVFHALNLNQNGLPYLFVKSITWSGGWPTIQP